MPGMAGRMPLLLAALLMTGAANVGCTVYSRPVPGCVPPSNEAALLDEFAKEPVLAIGPPGSKRHAEPRRQVACRRSGDHATETSVSVHYELSSNLGRDEVRAFYDPVAIEAGWAPLPTPLDAKGLWYCRRVLAQPAVLRVAWQDDMTIENEHVPATLSVVIHLAHDGTYTEWAEVEAARQAGCWP